MGDLFGGNRRRSRGTSGRYRELSPQMRTVIAGCIDDAMDPRASVATQLNAISLVSHGFPDGKPNAEYLVRYLQPRFAPEVQSASVQALGQCESAGVDALIPRLDMVLPSILGQAIDQFLQRQDATRVLLKRLEDGEVSASAMLPHQRNRLLSHWDKSIRVRAERLFGRSNANVKQVISRYRSARPAEWPDRADLEKGHLVYQRLCLNCHRFGGSGYEVGPSLATVAHRDEAFMLTALFDPNAAVEARYRQVQVVTEDGRALNGILAGQDDDTLTLLSNQAKSEVIARNEIEQLKSMKTSLMPSGMERDLSEDEFWDLLAYLRSGS